MINNLFNIDLKNQEIQFKFGGFYNSKHLAIIEHYLESTLDNIESDKIKEFKEEFFDFETTKINYAKALLKLIDKEFNTNFLDCFKEIWSPKQYNYQTDIIILDYKKFNFKDDNETLNKIETFLENVENYSDLEFEIAFFEIDANKIKKFIDENLNLNSEIIETILNNFSNLKNQNFTNFNDFKQNLIDVYDGEIVYYSNAIDYLKRHDPSLKNSLELACNFGYSLPNLNSEILASLLKQNIYEDLLNDNEDDLKIVFELFENHI